ncbi:hypothetical protein ACOMHN_053032 [Nucella lapillus]
MLFIDKLSSLQALSVINKTTPRPINLYGQAGTTVTGNLSAGRESDSDSVRFNTVHVPEFQKLMADMTQINGQ